MDLKGGELMHLQRFVLSGLLIGAALFLPTNALAEKADLVQKQPAVKELTTKAAAVAQEQVNENANTNPKIQVKAEREIPGKKEPVVSHSPQSSSVKPAQQIKTLPEQASNQAKTAVQAVEKTVKQTGKELLPEKAVTSPGKKKGLLIKKEEQPAHGKQPAPQGDAVKNNKPVKPIVIEKSSEQSLHNTEPKEEAGLQVSKASHSNQNQPASVTKAKLANEVKERLTSKTDDKSANKIKEQPINKTKANPIVSKKSNTQSPLVFAGPQKDNNPSGTDNSVPHEKQAINPSQSNQHSGGAAKDRAKAGNSSVNYTDKWLDWGHYWTLEISQSYTSRIKEFSNQWTNAPPSQPPKSFLFS